MPRAVSKDVLQRLLQPKTVAFFPSTRPSPRDEVSLKGIKVRQRGDVDVAIVHSKKATDRKAALASSSNVICLQDFARSPRIKAEQCLWGADCALWTPSIQVRLRAIWQPESKRPSFLILSESRSVAAHLLRHAKYRRLNVSGVLASGQLGKVRWNELVSAATLLPARPRILVAVERPLDLNWVLDNADTIRHLDLYIPPRNDQLAESPASVLRSGDTASPPDDPQPLAAKSILLDLGARVFDTPEQLIESAWLTTMSKGETDGRPLLVARDNAAAAILGDAATHNALETIAPNSIARAMNKTKTGVDCGHGALIVNKRRLPSFDDVSFTIGLPQQRGDSKTDLVYSPAQVDDRHASDTTLQALAIGPRRISPWNREPLVPSEEVTTLLDNLPAQLPDMQVRELCLLFGIESVPAKAVHSPSAAGKAAGLLGGTLELYAAGPQPRLYDAQWAQIEGLQSAAQVRQAYHKILRACTSSEFEATIDAMLVTRIPPNRVWLDAGLRWVKDTCIVQLVTETAESKKLSLELLAAPVDNERLRELFFDLSLSECEICQLDELVSKLMVLANSLSERMDWMRLYRIVLPLDETPAKIVQAAAKQRFHLRSIFG
jgi:hypothetical protein